MPAPGWRLARVEPRRFGDDDPGRRPAAREARAPRRPQRVAPSSSCSRRRPRTGSRGAARPRSTSTCTTSARTSSGGCRPGRTCADEDGLRRGAPASRRAGSGSRTWSRRGPSDPRTSIACSRRCSSASCATRCSSRASCDGRARRDGPARVPRRRPAAVAGALAWPTSGRRSAASSSRRSTSWSRAGLGHPQRAVRAAGARGPGHRDRRRRSGAAEARRPARRAWRGTASCRRPRTAARGDRAAGAGAERRTRRRPAPGRRRAQAGRERRRRRRRPRRRAAPIAGCATAASSRRGRTPRADAPIRRSRTSARRLALVEARVRAAVERRRARRSRPERPLPRPVHLATPGGRGCSRGSRRRSCPEPSPTRHRPRCWASWSRPPRPARPRARDVRLRRARADVRRWSPLDVELLLIALAPGPRPAVRAAVRLPPRRRLAAAGERRTRARARGDPAGVAAGAARARLGPLAPLVAGGLLLVEDADRPFLTRSLRVPDRVTAHLLGDDTPDPALAALLSRRPARPTSGTSSVLARALRAGVTLVYLRERPARPGASLAATALARIGRPAVELRPRRG